MSFQEPSTAPTGTPAATPPSHPDDSANSIGDRLNWLRAGVLGANDGIVSVAGVVVGVAGATSDRNQIMTAGVAALVAGALSMAGGEYVSVSTQRDTEEAAVSKETLELDTLPEQELDELTTEQQMAELELRERRGKRREP